MKTNILLALLCLLTISVSYGQVSFSMNFNLADPLQEYNENLTKTPKGFSTDVAVRVKETNFTLGGELGVSMFYNDTHLREMTEGGYPGTFIEISEEDCFLNYHLVARYHVFKEAMFNPYLEARVGGTSFFSTQIATEETYLFEDITQFHGTAFTPGIGGGLQIKFKDLPIGLDLATTANLGTFTHYRSINPEVHDISNLRMSDGQYESSTHHLNYRIGIRFNL